MLTHDLPSNSKCIIFGLINIRLSTPGPGVVLRYVKGVASYVRLHALSTVWDCAQ